VKKQHFHNTIKNLILSLFRATKSVWRPFVLLNKNLTIVAATIVIFVLVTGTLSEVYAKNLKTLSPDQVSINIFPSEVTSDTWKNVGSLSSQDLGENSLLQDFNIQNSAYLDTPNFNPINNFGATEVIEAVIPVIIDPATESSTNTNPNPIVDTAPQLVPTETTTENLQEPIVVPVKEPVIVEPASKPEPVKTNSEVPEEPAAEPVVYFSPKIYSVYNLEVKKYKLALAETLQLSEETTVPVSETVVEPPAKEVIKPKIIVPIELEQQTPSLITEDLTTDVPVPSVQNNKPIIKENDSEPEISFVGNAPTITLKGFNVPQFESGQFVDNLQLRLSLAGQYNLTESDQLPSLKISYSFNSFSGVAGSVLIEDEVSNALNGGYYLIPLPSITDSALLSDLTITISFEGDIENLKQLYVDSAWLEVTTVVYNNELLKNRFSKNEMLKHLTGLQNMELLSDRLDFLRDESPQFSLKYNSQRNFIVKAFRNLLGRDLVKVQSISFIHGGNEQIGVSPQITLTKDGLMSIVFDESDKAILKPGLYTVNIEVDEGGYISSDSFEFQWGLLSINPNQTEYSPDDVVDISMGALSSNGNTICDAKLNLYVTNPDGFISSLPVNSSGQCFGNNVIDVPDYSSQMVAGLPGEYEMYLESTNDSGDIVSHTTSTFFVKDNQSITIERNGPTRIFPPASYPMELTVHALDNSFEGELIERVPNDFVILDTEAEIRTYDDYLELVWQMSVPAGSSKTVSYDFDAPDLSPFLYELGPAQLISDVMDIPAVPAQSPKVPAPIAATVEVTEVDTLPIDSIAEPIESEPLPIIETVVVDESLTPEEILINEFTAVIELETFSVVTSPANVSKVVFLEHRKWQIASDATGNMILYWDDGATIPVGWSCLSCGSGTFFQKFAMGGSVYNTVGGATTHTHTAAGAVNASTLATTNSVGSTASGVAHTHTYTPVIDAISNLPLYRQLRVIQYTAGAGEPATIPAGAIGIFDVASSSLPSGWNRYAAQDLSLIHI